MLRHLAWIFILLTLSVGAWAEEAANTNELSLLYAQSFSTEESPGSVGVSWTLEHIEIIATAGQVNSLLIDYVWPLLNQGWIVPRVRLGGGYYFGTAGMAAAGVLFPVGDLGLRVETHLYTIFSSIGIEGRWDPLMIGLSYFF